MSNTYASICGECIHVRDRLCTGLIIDDFTGKCVNWRPIVDDKPIKDSGDRREYETGAQRDREAGKGLPILISPIFMERLFNAAHVPAEAKFSRTDLIAKAIRFVFSMLESRSFRDEFAQAIARLVMRALEADGGPPPSDDRYVFPAAQMRLAKHLEKGAIKYSARNWEKGMPLEDYLNSLLRHLFSWYAGEEDEDHGAASAFNIMGYIHTDTMIKYGLLPKSLALNTPDYISGGKNANTDEQIG